VPSSPIQSHLHHLFSLPPHFVSLLPGLSHLSSPVNKLFPLTWEQWWNPRGW
jgi:hypothetical protein